MLNLFIMVIFSMMAVVVYAGAKSMVSEAVYYERSAQALSISEAGLQDALHSLYLDAFWRAGFNKKSFAGGYYTVTLTTATSSLVLASSGYSSANLLTGRAVKTVTATVVFVSSTNPTSAILSNNLTVSGTVDSYDPRVTLTPTTFSSAATVWADAVTTSGSCPPVMIFGSVLYRTSGPTSACVSGTIASTTTVLTLPTHSCDATCQANDQNATGINPSSAWNSAANKLTVSAGNTVILSSGTYYFKDITVDGTLNVDTTTGPVNIFYTNSFTEKNGGCSVNNLSLIPSRLLIADTAGSHTVTLQCGAPLYAYMEGSTNHFNLQSGQFIYGHFSGGTTVIASGAGLHFDLSGGVPATHVDWTTGSAGAWAESYKRQ